MFQLFRALAARLQALFIAHVALDFESDMATASAERKATLLRQAADYDKEGLSEVASELRQRAAEIDLRQPLASVLPSLEHWREYGDAERLPMPERPRKYQLAHSRSASKKNKQ
ncbi:MAG: hypothetical protein AB7K24_16975 [Gemmataceae bacterium]